MHKPLMRWTIGGECIKEGLECLELATVKAKKLYPECEHFIVYNNLEDNALEFIKNIDVPLINASDYPCILDPGPDRTEWLIWPPRVRKEAHEITMDNDIILLRRHPVIDMFFQGDNFFFATESFNERHYGNYADIISEGGWNLNSGMYGMAPNFDFERWIINFYIKHGRREYHHANPQGVVAAMIKSQKNHRIISNKHILLSPVMRFVINAWDKILDREQTYGLHFTGVNRGMTVDNWINFKCSSNDEDIIKLREKWQSY